MLRNLARTFKPTKLKLSKDETCFLAYHPDVEHEYQYTKPLPKAEVGKESVLRVDSRNMFNKSPNLEQLQALTYTHASYWRNEDGKKKRKFYKESFNDNKDRYGLTS